MVASKKRMAGRPILRRTCARLVLFRAIPKNEISTRMAGGYFIFAPTRERERRGAGDAKSLKTRRGRKTRN